MAVLPGAESYACDPYTAFGHQNWPYLPDEISVFENQTFLHV